MHLKEHQAHVEALVDEAKDLERRASEAATEHIRQIKARRASRPDNEELVKALTTVIEARTAQLEAIRQLRDVLVDAAVAEPQTTRWERRRLRRTLERGVASMRSGVTDLEKLV
ncbi:hypothetical protein OHR68_35635 [Spirillospora sp. NBC_00431]